MNSNHPLFAYIQGKRYEFTPEMRIAGGGQAQVYRVMVAGEELAYKKFNPGSIDSGTLTKVKVMASATVDIPKELVWPIDVGYAYARVDGYLMQLLDLDEYVSFYDWLYDSSPMRFNLSTAVIAMKNLYRVIQELHSKGLVLADVLNWRNVFFNRVGEILLVDVDSIEIPSKGIKCVAYLPMFLPGEFNPSEIHGPYSPFSESTDNYAFAALFFTLIMGVPPFGGPHQDYKDETHLERARNGDWVFSDGSLIAERLSTELLTEDMLIYFSKVFTQGLREPFPVTLLQRYLVSLVNCSNEDCLLEYPADIEFCPYCGSPNNNIREVEAVMTKDHSGSRIRILDLESSILHAELAKGHLFVLSNQPDGLWVHSLASECTRSYRLLEQCLPIDSQITQLGTVVAIGQPGLDEVVFLNIEITDSSKPYYIGKISDCARNSYGEFIMAATDHHFSYMNNAGEYVRVRIYDGGLRTVTMFDLAENNVLAISGFKDQPGSILVTLESGITKIKRMDGSSYRVMLPGKPERDIDLVRVLFDVSGDVVLIRRVYHSKSEKNSNWVVSALINSSGKVFWSGSELLSDYPSMMSLQTGMFGTLGAEYVLLHITPDCVMVDKMESAVRYPIPETVGQVEPTALLTWFGTDFAMVCPQIIYRISLNKGE